MGLRELVYILLGCIIGSGMILVADDITIKSYEIQTDNYSLNLSEVSCPSVTCPVCENIKDYNFTCVFEYPKLDLYWANVLPSKQCKGISISQMTKLNNVESTGSMRPTIFGGDVLLVTKYNNRKELVVGDIVVTEDMVSHRIIALNDDSEVYYLKGDNNARADFLAVPYENTKYVVCGVMRGTE